MSDQPPNFNFGEGSQGAPWVPSPGFHYAGDAWCAGCNQYVPVERSDAQANVARFGRHAGVLANPCPGSGTPALLRQAREDF